MRCSKLIVICRKYVRILDLMPSIHPSSHPPIHVVCVQVSVSKDGQAYRTQYSSDETAGDSVGYGDMTILYQYICVRTQIGVLAMRRDPNNKYTNTTTTYTSHVWTTTCTSMMSMFTGIIVDLDDSPPPDTTPGWATSAHTKERHYYCSSRMSRLRTDTRTALCYEQLKSLP